MIYNLYLASVDFLAAVPLARLGSIHEAVRNVRKGRRSRRILPHGQYRTLVTQLSPVRSLALSS
jgi:hypothetical protein